MSGNGAYVAQTHRRDFSAGVSYFEVGVGLEARQHRAAGTSRAAVVMGDFVDSAELMSYANEMMQRTSRKVMGFQGVYSVPSTWFDPSKAEDQQAVANLAYETLRRAYPDSPVMLWVHNDTDNLHAHYVVVNECLDTGKAITKNRMHWQVRDISDDYLREQGLSVMTPSQTKTSQRQHWEAKRNPDFDDWEQYLVDTVGEVLNDPKVTTRDELANALGVRDVEYRVRVSKDGKETGISFAIIGEPEHTKAGGRMGEDFKLKGVDASLADNAQRLAAERSREQLAAQEAAREAHARLAAARRAEEEAEAAARKAAVRPSVPVQPSRVTQVADSVSKPSQSRLERPSPDSSTTQDVPFRGTAPKRAGRRPRPDVEVYRKTRNGVPIRVETDDEPAPQRDRKRSFGLE